MRWFAMVASTLVGCTAANPAFDLLDGEDDSAASLEGPGDDAAGSSGGSEESGTDAVDGCGPFVDPATVTLTVDGARVCGLYAVTGTIEAITDNEIHIRCDSEFDSDCLPDALAILRIDHGIPPELSFTPDRTMQLSWDTTDDVEWCEFKVARLQAGDELRETFVALGLPGIFQTELTYQVDAEMAEACECTECCALPQGQYRLVKHIQGAESIALAEGEEADRMDEELVYRYRNIAANVTGDCRKSFHWQAVRLQ